MKIELRALALVALWACAPAKPPQAPSVASTQPTTVPTRQVSVAERGISRAPTPEEQSIIAQLARVTERIRGLQFISPIDVRIENREAMRAYVSSALDDEDIERARRRYVALGVIDDALNIRALLEALMEEELIGYYDPKQKRLAVRDDVARAFSEHRDAEADLEWRATVVHELVHALQDQHLGLGVSLQKQRSTDADDAFGALIEGDATMAMLAYAADVRGQDVTTLAQDARSLKRLLTSTPETLTGALRNAPPIVREPLLFRYREGALFAADLIREGGFTRIDRAHRDPPPTTRDVQHSASYVKGSHARVPALPLEDLVLAASLSPLDEDSLGSFELGVVLSSDPITRTTIERMWRADRYVVFERDGMLGALWLIEVDSTDSARKLAAIAQRVSPDLSRGARVGVVHVGRRVVITRRCSPEQTTHVRRSLEGTSLVKASTDEP